VLLLLVLLVLLLLTAGAASASAGAGDLLVPPDLFTFHPEAPADAKQGQGMVRPVLRALEVPVRAVVMPIPGEQ
jgi:hypothetical protein